jgi:hypothetical protein
MYPAESAKRFDKSVGLLLHLGNALRVQREERNNEITFAVERAAKSLETEAEVGHRLGDFLT